MSKVHPTIIIAKEYKPKINKDCGHIQRDKKGNPTNWEQAKKWGYKKRSKYYGYNGGNDPLGIEQAKVNKLNTIVIDKQSDNVIDKFLMEHTPKDLLHKKVWAIKSDNSRMFCGWVVDVYSARYLLCKVNGENLPLKFEHIISIGDE